MASGMVPSGIRKKKPRKSKGKDNDEESVAGGRGTSTSAPGKRRGSRDQTADISEDGGDEPRVEASAERKADRVRREARQRVIANHFDEQQFARYEAWRASRLPPATVRRVCCSYVLEFAKLMKVDCQSNTLTIGAFASHRSSTSSGQVICWRYD
jgi:transcription initiation factor TFIID subunit 11